MLLRTGERRKVVAPQLGLSLGQLGRLLSDPPWSEDRLEAKAIDDAAYRKRVAAERREWKARRVAAQQQLQCDEAHEVKAQAAACLIAAFIEMRAYVMSEDPAP